MASKKDGKKKEQSVSSEGALSDLSMTESEAGEVRGALTSLSATSTTLYPCAARGPVVDPGAPAAAPIPKV